MTTHLKTLLCWRAWALGTMGVSALLLLICEADGVWTNIAAKAGGACLMAAANLLYRRWDRKGRLGALGELLRDGNE